MINVPGNPPKSLMGSENNLIHPLRGFVNPFEIGFYNPEWILPPNFEPTSLQLIIYFAASVLNIVTVTPPIQKLVKLTQARQALIHEY